MKNTLDFRSSRNILKQNYLIFSLIILNYLKNCYKSVSAMPRHLFGRPFYD